MLGEATLKGRRSNLLKSSPRSINSHVEIKLDAKASAELTEISRELGLNAQQSVRQGLALLLLYKEIKQKGGLLLWETKDGERRELVVENLGA